MAYFTEAELRDLPQMNDATKYPTARVTAARNWIEGVIERKVGTSFEARSFTETVGGDEANCRGGILLSRPYVISVTAVTSNGVAFTAGQLAEITINPAGLLIRRTAGSYGAGEAWDTGVENIAITYTAGYSTTPPVDIKEAALTAARDWLLRRYQQQGASDRAVSLQTEMGNITYASASDKHDRPTGIPDVDAVIMGWVARLDVFGFA